MELAYLSCIVVVPFACFIHQLDVWNACKGRLKGEVVFINGDGETSRDFCFIENAVQMNILSATAPEKVSNAVYNVAVGDRTTLNNLFVGLKTALNDNNIPVNVLPTYRNFRAGDVRHSLADISKSKNALGYMPEFKILDGILLAMPWYISFIASNK